MSILIHGIKMPTHCIDCPFMISRDNDDCILQSAEANESFENWEQMRARCPLINVSPHGRLVDADALIREHRTDNFDFAIYATYLVQNAPTVLEAEEEINDIFN